LPFIPFIIFPFLNALFFHLEFKEILGLYSYYLLLFFLGLVVYPFMSLFFPHHPDGAYGASRIFGLVLFSYLLWSVTAFFNMPLLHLNILGVLIFLCFIFVAVIFIHDDALLFVKHKKDLIIVETLFSFLFFFFLIQFSMHPEAYGGEKAMDFSLLSYFTRLEYLPPHDPWAQGSLLRYYYWGYFLFSELLKGAGLIPKVGYLVAMASIGPLMAVACYSFLLGILRRRFLALWGALSIVLACNYQSLINLFTKRPLDFSYFWSATRVFKMGLFAEFPSWSFTFLDLHPHVMAYPFVILALLFIWRFFETRFVFNFSFCFFAGISLGVLAVTNFWDFLIVYFLFGMIVLFNFRRAILPSLLTFFISIIFYLPISFVMLVGREGGSFLSFEKDSYNGLFEFLSHQGQWWFFIGWAFILGFVFYIFKKRMPKIDYGFKSFLLLLGASFALMIFSNYFILVDKINSIFKMNTTVWVLMGLGSFAILRKFSFMKFKYRVLFFSPLLIFTFVLLAGNMANISALSSFTQSSRPRPLLEATAFLKTNSFDYALAIEKMNTEVIGDKNILEPYGKTYDFESNKLSIYTGLSSYLVWPGQHVNQRGLSWKEIETRKAEVDSFYQTIAESTDCTFLKAKRIDFVEWTGEALTSKCLKIWFEGKNLKIYKTSGN